jgi:hypothetical protein
VIHLGDVPGDGPPGAKLVGLLAGAAFAASAVLAVILVRRRDEGTPLAAALSPAAAVFMVAHFYTYDSYYLPSLIRYSERDFMPPFLVFSFAALSAGAGLLAWGRRPVGLALTAPVVLVCGLTAWYSGLGH